MVTVDLIAILIKGLAYLAMLQGAGTALFIAVFGRQLQGSLGVIRRLGILTVLVAAAAVIGAHVLEAGRMTGEFSGVMDGHLQARLMHSSMAAATGARLLGLAVLLAVMATSASVRIAPALVGAALVTTSFTLLGHTVSHEPRWVLASLLELHLLIGSCWVGAIVPLIFVASRESPERAHALVQRFSGLASWLVPVTGFAGLVMAWLLTGGKYVRSDPYTASLTGKVALFALALLFAAVNRFRLGPALKSGRNPAVSRFRLSLSAELFVLACLIALTATMTSLFSPAQ